MKKLIIFIKVGLLATAVGILSGCGGPSVAQIPSGAATQPDKPADVQRVTAGPPVRKTLTLHTLQPGRIEAFEATPLYSKLSGYVDEVVADIGDKVEKDQVLVRLWVPETQDELAQKQALLDQANAEVRQAEAGGTAAEAALGTARAKVEQAQAGVSGAEADRARWKAEHARILQLAAGGSVTQKLVDETLNQFRAAEAAQTEASAAVESARAAVSEAQANVKKAAADVAAAEARSDVAAANLKQAETMAAYREIKAPFQGVVTHRNVDTRHYVQPAGGSGTKPLVIVVRNDRLRVFVDVPETEAGLVDVGDVATVRVQALQHAEIAGEVTRTSWALDAASRSLRVEIDLDNAEGALRPGMYATVQIRLAERQDALVLPVTAIIRDAGETFCCCVESGEIVRRLITLGLRSGSEIEVVSGLQGDETVVLARAEALKSGQPVEILSAEQK